MNDWENHWKKHNQLIRDLVRRGIPLHFRAIVWQLLCSAAEAPEKKLYAEYIKVQNCVQNTKLNSITAVLAVTLLSDIVCYRLFRVKCEKV